MNEVLHVAGCRYVGSPQPCEREDCRKLSQERAMQKLIDGAVDRDLDALMKRRAADT